MTQDDSPIEAAVRSRLRSLRAARGWSLDELARRAHIGPSTISRIETGHRRVALDQLVALARALETTVDELLAEGDEEDVVIRPRKDVAHGSTYWHLTRADDPSGRTVTKMRVPLAKRSPELQVHPGRDWFFVLSGTARLRLGEREVLVEAGQAAEFDTMVPHAIGGHGGPVEVLSIFDHHGERAHLRAP
ncbi:helix-turn-helix transcriptional regulator [Aquihabitans sp. G128]|uniref:helix-turn-helix transcriptional regulator n=1 Tax=Aquihabitans sp. G128 TaxID=2849779 RepID=UPI001C214E4C|nr:helix-turn-helix transcriptional regulator [Aquihabitans sp. G128]QXC60914.1 helix-turn-helix transcriptional regulator [Aquihabitans sp. G128]